MLGLREKAACANAGEIALKAVKEKPLQAFQRTDRWNLVNAINLATYNAERLLARKFSRQCQDPRDWLTIFRSCFHLSGSISYSDKHLLVELHAPDRPAQDRCCSSARDWMRHNVSIDVGT